MFFFITECHVPLKWSRLEIEVTKDQQVGYHVGHCERFSVSDAGVPHVNFLVVGTRTRMAKLTAVSPLTPELKAPLFGCLFITV